MEKAQELNSQGAILDYVEHIEATANTVNDLSDVIRDMVEKKFGDDWNKDYGHMAAACLVAASNIHAALIVADAIRSTIPAQNQTIHAADNPEV